MALTHIPFGSMPWTGGAHPLEKKKTAPGCGASLLKFEARFADPNWCERSHVLYVLQGALGLELRDREAVVRAGECAVLSKGTAHRAKNAGEGAVILFVVSDSN